jgi:hypothetical protein
LTECRRLAGTQFYPGVVAALEQLLGAEGHVNAFAPAAKGPGTP